MKDDLRSRIATFCGWRWDEVGKCWRDGIHDWVIAYDDGRLNRMQIPDYLNDLNAMHIAESHLGEVQQMQMNEVMYCDMPEIKRVWRATAAERAEAYGRVIKDLSPAA